MSFSISGRSESSWDPEITLLFMAGFIFQFLSKIYRGLNANLVYIYKYITDNMRSRRARGRVVCVRATVWYACDERYVYILLVWKVHIIIYLILYISHILDFRQPPICNNTTLGKYIYMIYTPCNAVVPVINACIIIPIHTILLLCIMCMVFIYLYIYMHSRCRVFNFAFSLAVYAYLLHECI